VKPPTRLGQAITRASHRLADRAVHVAADLGYRLPSGDPNRRGIDFHPDIPYTGSGHRAHRLDVYRPRDAKGPLPVVVYVHGGGFAMLSKKTHRLFALAFAARGYLVFNVDYRLGREHVYPAPLEDAADALRFASRECARWGGDRDRLSLSGESAGANLVTALAIAACVERPEPFARALRAEHIPIRSVMPTYGLLDLTDLDRLRRWRPLPTHLWVQIHHAAESYLGEPLPLAAARAPLANPLAVIERLSPAEAAGLPPFFLSCGTKDPLLDDTRRLHAALGRLGVSSELVVHPGEIHGYDALFWRPAARDKWRRQLAFLERRSEAVSVSVDARAASG
jgi:acetyl esterase